MTRRSPSRSIHLICPRSTSIPFPLRQWCAEITNCSFDICAPQGAPTDTWSKFYPFDDKPMIGKFHEVPCSQWTGSEGISISKDSCMAPADAPRWPKHSACGNKGTRHSLACAVMQFLLMYTLRMSAPLSELHRIRHNGTGCSYCGSAIIYTREMMHKEDRDMKTELGSENLNEEAELMGFLTGCFPFVLVKTSYVHGSYCIVSAIANQSRGFVEN